MLCLHPSRRSASKVDGGQQARTQQHREPFLFVSLLLAALFLPVFRALAGTHVSTLCCCCRRRFPSRSRLLKTNPPLFRAFTRAFLHQPSSFLESQYVHVNTYLSPEPLSRILSTFSPFFFLPSSRTRIRNFPETPSFNLFFFYGTCTQSCIAIDRYTYLLQLVNTHTCFYLRLISAIASPFL